MAVKQYIGARYVPKFYDVNGSSEWTPNTVYEPLTIVTRGGNSYTSKKRVPAATGTPELNPGYWAPTGIFNEQVQELANEVSAIEIALQSYMDSAATFNNVPMLLMGNSWAAGVGGVLGRGFTYYMQEYSGCDADFIQVRGGDFVETGNAGSDYPGKTAEESLTLWAAGQTADRLNSIKYVVYGGGLNDASNDGISYESEYAAVESFINKCKQLMPNAKIYIIPLSSLAVVNRGHYRKYVAMIDASAANGAVSNENFHSWFYGRLEYKTTDDNYSHLNDSGYRLCAQYVLSFMRGWNGDYVPNPEPLASLGPNLHPDSVVTQIYCKKEHGMVWLTGQVAHKSGTQFEDNEVLFTIEPKYRPMGTVYLPMVYWQGNDPANRSVGFVVINSSGNCLYRAQAFSPLSASNMYFTGVAYPINEA